MQGQISAHSFSGKAHKTKETSISKPNAQSQLPTNARKLEQNIQALHH